MIPKPPRLRPNPKRLPERKAVTIIAGFKCYGGIVLCSDTQETLQGSPSKRNIPKLRFESVADPGNNKDLAAAFCGSGDGPFIDKLVENAWHQVQVATDIEAASDKIEKSIKDIYKEFGRIYQPGYCPSAELIYGIKMHGESRLFSANGPVVNQKSAYQTAGAGYYMADFLAERMYKDYLGIYECVILSAYILFQAKEHVDGCGGESHIAVLREDAISGLVDYYRIEKITNALQFADYEAGNLLLEAANLAHAPEQLKKRIQIFENLVNVVREARNKEIEEREAMALRLGSESPKELDELGFPKPSAS
jgi:20S proteasome alpha/beta subunit